MPRRLFSTIASIILFVGLQVQGAVLISLGGNTAGDGFLVAPVGSTYDTDLALWTDAGTLAVTLQTSPDAAGLVFSQTNINLSTTPTIVKVHAVTQSTSRGDTTIQVLDGATIVASFTVTCIKHPKVNFRGRFEARFATDGASPFSNVFYTPSTTGSPGPGWTWGLEGEPNFVPIVGNVPENLETTGVGRVIRLNDPVSLRSHAAAVVSIVDSITGDTVLGPETFNTGDPLIGQPVNFGPDTYFAGNQPLGASTPEEYYDPAVEPMALFELHFGTLFSGGSMVGPFTHKATVANERTRSPDSRPIATGLPSAAAEMAEFGLPSLAVFSETRVDLLVADYNALPAGDTPERRNLARRIGHLLARVSSAKRDAVQAANPGAFTIRTGTLPQGWSGKEVYTGKVDSNLLFNPGTSAVVAYMSEFTSFNVEWVPFSYHSDELCGHHKGHLTHLNFDGSYSGDPHTRTVDGTRYDFQAVGEFTLLRGSGMEVQVRQSPVATQHPITDGYTGLTACVSVNTAVAARLGKHRVSLQPGQERGRLQFYLDGKPTSLKGDGIDVEGHRVSAFDANGEMGLRVDFEDETVLTVTPLFWAAHNIWYMNIRISNTSADEGIMGFIPQDSWLPRMRNGVSVGPMPTTPHERYSILYKKFADSWRLSEGTSLFVYAPGTSTKTFTDRDWPDENPPCKSKQDLQVPGVPIFKGMPTVDAQFVCNKVIERDLRENCIFDVATTGDIVFAEGYLLTQELGLHGTRIQLIANVSETPQGAVRVNPEGDQASGEPTLTLIAKVLPLTSRRPTPTGSVLFYVDGVPMKRPVELDERGSARSVVRGLKPGEHSFRATFSGGGRFDYHGSSSTNLFVQLGVPKGGGKNRAKGSAGIQGSVVVRVSIGDKETDLIPIPDIEIQVRNLRTQETSIVQTTDLMGRYASPLLEPGEYRLFWKAQAGWAAGQYGKTIKIDGHMQYPLPLELIPEKGHSLLIGRVQLADGGSPWFQDEFFGISRFATVKRMGVQDFTPIRANYAGDFAVVAETPIEKGKLEAQVESSVGSIDIAPADWIALDGRHPVKPVIIKIKNHRPRVDSTTMMLGQDVITAVAPTTTVKLVASVSDADGDRLNFEWRDSGGGVLGITDQIPWTSPAKPGGYPLYLRVSDKVGGDVIHRLDVNVTGERTTMSGRVVDSAGKPLVNARVTLNGESGASDKNGFFKIRVPEAKPDERFLFNVTLTGFVPISRLLDRAVSGQSWRLIPTQTQKVDARKPIKLIDERPILRRKKLQGARIAIPADALVDAGGKPPTGELNASFATIDISDDESPGDFLGLSNRRAQVALISYGMLYVDFSNDAGNRFNLRPGSEAEIIIPIPEPMRKSAPAQIIVWHYDMNRGVWNETGRADLQTDRSAYRTSVKHFSTINMDQPGDVACLKIHSDISIPTGLKLRVSDVAGEGIEFSQVKTAVLDGPLNAVYRIPANNKVQLQVLDRAGNELPNIVLENGNSVKTVGTRLPNNEVDAGAANPVLWPAYPYDGCKDVTLKLDALWSGYPASPFLTLFSASNIGSLEQAEKYYAFLDPAGERDTLEKWWLKNGFSPTGGAPFSGGEYTRTSYLNDNDLGSGRDMHFLKHLDGRLSAYVTNYSRFGPFDQNPVFAQDAADHFQGFATVCMELGPVEGQADTTPVVKFFVYAETNSAKPGTDIQYSADLDGFGQKHVPTLCLNCHGGRYQPGPDLIPTIADLSGDINRSHFRELDLSTYLFPDSRTVATPAEQAAFRRQNLMIRETEAARGPIHDLIDGWYASGSGDQDNSYTPTAWDDTLPQRNLYHDVVKVSCRTCHIAFDSADDDSGIDWNRYDQMRLRSGFVGSVAVGNQISLPSNRRMPHALVTYRNFWIHQSPAHRPTKLWEFEDLPDWEAFGPPVP